MQPELEVITKEIPAKGKGYILIRKCWPDQVDEAVRQGARKLLGEGATSIFAASTDPSAPLCEGAGEGYRLEFRHDMLGMERTGPGPPPPGGADHPGAADPGEGRSVSGDLQRLVFRRAQLRNLRPG